MFARVVSRTFARGARTFGAASRSSSTSFSRVALPSGIALGVAGYALTFQPISLDSPKTEKKAESVESKEEQTDIGESNDSVPKDEEESQDAAYNPETGEINWDCPCLGGMAHGPCGEDFKKAFSCFVYSEAEPKGIDCVENFQAMQDCFRKYPEIYSEELRDESPLDENSEGVEVTVSETIQEPNGDVEVVEVSETIPNDLEKN